MKTFFYILGGLFILAVIVSGVWCASDTACSSGVVENWKQDAAQAATQESDPSALYGLYAAVGIASLIIVGNFIGSAFENGRGGIVVFTVIMLVLLGVVGVYIYGDKDGDGAGDTQIVVVVQPSGADAETDLTYSEVNQGNAKANLINVSALVSLVFVLLIAVIVAGGAALLLGRRSDEV